MLSPYPWQQEDRTKQCPLDSRRRVLQLHQAIWAQSLPLLQRLVDPETLLRCNLLKPAGEGPRVIPHRLQSYWVAGFTQNASGARSLNSFLKTIHGLQSCLNFDTRWVIHSTTATELLHGRIHTKMQVVQDRWIVSRKQWTVSKAL